jgi:acyl-CoA synthetase (NDP forming)
MAPAMPRPGRLGLFTQSAAIGVSVYAAAFRRGLGLSSFLSAGNRADVSGNDVMQFWEDDPDTAAVGLYLESMGNPRKFSRLARRLARSKAVIVAKSDLTGLSLPPGHVGRTTMAPPSALDAMMRQSGVISVETVEQLMDVAQIVSSQPLPQGPGVAVVSNSAALGKVVADSAGHHGLRVERLLTGLDLDSGASVSLDRLRLQVQETLAGTEVHSLIAAMIPARSVSMEDIAKVLSECAAGTGKAVVAAVGGVLDPAARLDGLLPADAADSGIPCYSSPGNAVAALSAVVGYSAWLDREQGLFVEPEGCDPDGTREELDRLLATVHGEQLLRLEPQDATSLLTRYGMAVEPSAVFEHDDDAVAAAGRLGWPVALKTTDPALRHRIDLGGVRLDIEDAESLRRNIAQMRRALEPFASGSPGSPALEVQAMAPVGQACTFRAIEDPLLGPVVSFGLAGDAVNLLDDWAHRVPPLSATDVRDFIRSPRASLKLFGYQGLPAVDVAALEDLAARLARLKDEHPEIALVEFNPVLAGPEGARILAAEVWIGNAARRTDSARRAMRG